MLNCSPAAFLKELRQGSVLRLEKFSLNFSSSSFAIRVNLRHPWPILFLFHLFLPLGCLSSLANYYFKVLFVLQGNFL